MFADGQKALINFAAILKALKINIDEAWNKLDPQYKGYIN